MLPGMRGWTLLEAGRRLDGHPDLPIIAMSAVFAVLRAATALHTRGVRACLAKPFEINALLSLVGEPAGTLDHARVDTISYPGTARSSLGTLDRVQDLERDGVLR
jgi:CheY-like chemotaxis protein